MLIPSLIDVASPNPLVSFFSVAVLGKMNDLSGMDMLILLWDKVVKIENG